jgi:hypothetical protein
VFQKFITSIQGSSKKNKRHAPIKELVDTEDKYLENLIMVRDKFRDRLTFMSNQDKNIIFYKLVRMLLIPTYLQIPTYVHAIWSVSSSSFMEPTLAKPVGKVRPLELGPSPWLPSDLECLTARICKPGY